MLHPQFRQQEPGFGAETGLFPALGELFAGLLVPGVGQLGPLGQGRDELLVLPGNCRPEPLEVHMSTTGPDI